VITLLLVVTATTRSYPTDDKTMLPRAEFFRARDRQLDPRRASAYAAAGKESGRGLADSGIVTLVAAKSSQIARSSADREPT
jgi:hypothetical protein